MRGARIIVVCSLAVGGGCGGKSSDEPSPAPTPATKVADAPGPKVLFGQVELEGPRGGDAVVEVAHAHRDALLACYTDRLEDQADLEGEVALRLLIAPGGEVQDAMIHNNTLPDHRVATCMMRVAKAWSFPASQDAAPTRINLPVHVRPN
jgi:hypothetical protein